jgi:threonine dehydratase
MYPLAAAHIGRAVLVPDAAILAAQRLLWQHLRVVVEPGGATALAALTTGAYTPAPGENVGVLLCGANCTAVSFPETV